jgi:hypothetical protein
MKKPFLLILGFNFYPCPGSSDWKGRFDSHQEAEAAFKKIEHPEQFYTTKTGKIRKGVAAYTSYKFEGTEYDWYEIVDLETVN